MNELRLWTRWTARDHNTHIVIIIIRSTMAARYVDGADDIIARTVYLATNADHLH